MSEITCLAEYEIFFFSLKDSKRKLNLENQPVNK